jgi:RNA polymerase sigma-70 factor (ECF subfamily)
MPPANPPSSDERRRFEAEALPFMKAVYNTALRLIRREEDARDLVQETYVRAYRTFDGFTPGTNCKAWLFTILYSIFVNKYRKEQREPAMVSIDELEEKFHHVLRADSPSQPAEHELWTDAEVEAALGELPESFRSAVLLVDVEELSYEEAAVALGCPLGTLRSRLSRGRKLLSVSLRDYAARAGYRSEKA